MREIARVIAGFALMAVIFLIMYFWGVAIVVGLAAGVALAAIVIVAYQLGKLVVR